MTWKLCPGFQNCKNKYFRVAASSIIRKMENHCGGLMLTLTLPGMYTLNRNQLQSSMKILSYKKLSQNGCIFRSRRDRGCNNHWQEEISHVCSWYSGSAQQRRRRRCHNPGVGFFWDLEYFLPDKLTWYGLKNPKSQNPDLGTGCSGGGRGGTVRGVHANQSSSTSRVVLRSRQTFVVIW